MHPSEDHPRVAPLLPPDIESPIVQAHTVSGCIGAGEVMVIVAGRYDSERTGLGLRRGQGECDGVTVYGPGQGAAIIIGGIREGALPRPRQLVTRLGYGEQERPHPRQAIGDRTRPRARQIGLIVARTP